jgi:hypothetical protein
MVTRAKRIVTATISQSNHSARVDHFEVSEASHLAPSGVSIASTDEPWMSYVTDHAIRTGPDER